MIVGGSEDLFASIAAGEYFGEDVPTLIINTGSKFTKALTSFIQALKTDTEVSISMSFQIILENTSCKDDVKQWPIGLSHL